MVEKKNRGGENMTEANDLDLTENEIERIKDILKNYKNVQNIKIVKEITNKNLLMKTTTFVQLNKLDIKIEGEEVEIKKIF